VGRIYQQTFIDTYSKGGLCQALRSQDSANGSRSAQRPGAAVFRAAELVLSRVLTDRGTEYCGTDRHEYELYLAVEDIDHTRTQVKSPQTNGICERFHKTVLNEFYRVAFRKKIYKTLNELQTDLDAWLSLYNEQRPHQGRWCYGKTPMQTFIESIPLAKEKMIAP
jgi:transposase InsO family protein